MLASGGCRRGDQRCRAVELLSAPTRNMARIPENAFITRIQSPRSQRRISRDAECRTPATEGVTSPSVIAALLGTNATSALGAGVAAGISSGGALTTAGCVFGTSGSTTPTRVALRTRGRRVRPRSARATRRTSLYRSVARDTPNARKSLGPTGRPASSRRRTSESASASSMYRPVVCLCGTDLLRCLA